MDEDRVKRANTHTHEHIRSKGPFFISFSFTTFLPFVMMMTMMMQKCVRTSDEVVGKGT